VLLRYGAETFLAQSVEVLAGLDASGTRVYVQGTQGAFPVKLRDERAFRLWLDEARPGKIRVIQRADGFELQTDLGKLPGPDANGPSLPTRSGTLDVAALREGLARLKARFPDAPDACLVPSFGTEWVRVAEALEGFYGAPQTRLFSEVCLVYPSVTPLR
jgi:hypothetical protein